MKTQNKSLHPLILASLTFFLILGPKSLAQSLPTSGTVNLNQAEQILVLGNQETETVFETRDIPSTCYRTVQRGSRQDCRTEYDRQCSTQMENICRSVPYQECDNVPERVCRTIPRNVCTTQQVCRTVNDTVCRGAPPNQVCQNIPRRECSSQNVCRTERDSVCHTETRRRCYTSTRQECSMEPRTSCVNVPRQACQTVPNYEQETYACTKPQQFPVGTRVVLNRKAEIKVKLVGSAMGLLDPLKNQIRIQLRKNGIQVSAESKDQSVLFQRLLQNTQSVQESANQLNLPTEIVIQADLIENIRLDSLQVSSPKILKSSITTEIQGFLGNAHRITAVNLELNEFKNRRKYFTLHEGAVDLRQMTVKGQEMNLSMRGILGRELNTSRNHNFTLNIKVVPIFDRDKVLNPSVLPLLKERSLEIEHSAFPI